jgi:signal transduction histidine kinase
VKGLASLLRTYGFDALIVVAAAGGAVEVAARGDSLREPGTALWVAAAAIALVVLPLLGRRRFPFAAPAAVWLVGAAVSFADGQLVVSSFSAFAAGIAAAFLLGNLRDDRQSRLGLAIAVASAVILALNNPDHAAGDVVTVPLLFAIAWLAGLALRERAQQAEAAEERAAHAERSRIAQGDAVAGLVRRLGQAPEPAALRAALADGLGDPSLALAYWLPSTERFVDAEGRPMSLRDRTWTEVELDGRRIGAIVHRPSLAAEPQLVRTAGAAAALALENQRLSAELRARIEELRTSRTRLVEAGDAERRRLERNLHDGAQSRLVALAVKLRLARAQAEGQPELTAILDESSAELQASLDELRELARGIHPALLSARGLCAALEALASRAPVPVRVACNPGEDLPPSLETAIYYVVSEGLTNVAKYARAETGAVTVRRQGGRVVVEVKDDGVGGAELTGGSGLRGLSDRVAALDGRLELRSPPGGGTTVRAEFPVVGRGNGRSASERRA